MAINIKKIRCFFNKFGISTVISKKFWRDESGASAVEYGLIIACITLALVLGFTKMGDKAQGLFSDITQKIENRSGVLNGDNNN